MAHLFQSGTLNILWIHVDFGTLPQWHADQVNWKLWVRNLSRFPFFFFIHAFISSCQVFGVGLFPCHTQSTMTWLQFVQGTHARLLTNTRRSYINPCMASFHWLPAKFRFQNIFPCLQGGGDLTLHLLTYWAIRGTDPWEFISSGLKLVSERQWSEPITAVLQYEELLSATAWAAGVVLC